MSWIRIGGASSLILAAGNSALDYFSQNVRMLFTAGGLRLCVCVSHVILGLLTNTVHELVSNPKHPVLTLFLTGHIAWLTDSY